MPTPPIFVTPTDPTIIQGEIQAAYEAAAGRTLQPADIEMLMIAVMAYRESLVRLGIQYQGEQGLLSFASAPALDYIGELLGVSRLPAIEAETTIQFDLNPAHGGITIPSGTRVSTADKSTIFETVEDVTAGANVTPVTVTAQAQTPGTGGNGYAAGTVTNILDPVAGVLTATNTTTTSGGSDAEEDEALRTRIKLATAQFSTCGSVEAYKFHALSANPGIADVSIPSPPAVPGTVVIYPLMADGTITPANVLAQVLAACNAENVRPLSDTVSVIAPTRQNYTIDIDLVIYVAGDATDAIAAVTAAAQAFATAQRRRMGIDIIGTQIITACHKAYDLIYSVTLTGWGDVTVSESQYGFCTGITCIVSATTPG